ncbi:MAG: GNAT family N-acetyltransferase [Alphaproteobacteria bacterium]
MASDISIRFARPDERRALEELQRRASLANEHDREAILAHPEAIDLPPEQIAAQQVRVAERDGSVVGFAVTLPREDGQAELDGLFVEPGLWKGGTGRALVEDAGAMARQMGCASLHVVGNPHALGFYEACGFETVGTFETRFGPGILMRLSL